MATDSNNCDVNNTLVSAFNKISKLPDSSSGTFSPKLEFDDGDLDDDLDPAMKEELDRQVDPFSFFCVIVLSKIHSPVCRIA